MEATSKASVKTDSKPATASLTATCVRPRDRHKRNEDQGNRIMKNTPHATAPPDPRGYQERRKVQLIRTRNWHRKFTTEAGTSTQSLIVAVARTSRLLGESLHRGSGGRQVGE